MSTAAQATQAWVEGARRSWQASPLPGFLQWWAGELRPLLPTRWRGWFRSGVDWQLLLPVGAGWSLRRAGIESPLLRWDNAVDARIQIAALHRFLNAVDPADRRVALLLPASVVLRRKLSLPLAARNDLSQVLAFEMDRQTPFTVTQVYYAAHEPVNEAAAGYFQVELVAVPCAVLDPILAHLATQGLIVDAVDVAADNGRLGINLLPLEQRPRHSRPRQRVNVLLAAVCMLLLVFGLAQWLHNRRAALAQMQTTVSGMQHEAQQVALLRQQLRDSIGAAAFLAERKRNAITMLSVLEDVTTRFPDSAWLERFSVDSSGQIGLQGQSQQAAKLLDALNSSPVIVDARFQGSIQPEASTGKERFYLMAHVREPTMRTSATGPSAAQSASSGSAQ